MDRIPSPPELSFRVGFSGHSGHLRFQPLPPVLGDNHLLYLPDFVSPPAFPEESSDSIKVYIEEKYLLPRLDPDEFAPDKAGRHWEFDWFDKGKIPLDASLPRSSVVPSWEVPFRRSREQLLQGKWQPESVQVDMSELIVGEEDSAALPQITGPAKDFLRGSINNRPFRPGGLDASQPLSKVVPNGASSGEWIRKVLDGGIAETTPPSFKKGLELGELNVYSTSWNIIKQQGPVKDVDCKQGDLSLQFDDLFKRAWEDDVAAKDEAEELEATKPEANELKEEVSSDIVTKQSFEIDAILAGEPEVSAMRSDEKNDKEEPQKESWAVAGGSEVFVEKFHEHVPDMALEFPFELDTFQKEAIYHLEKGESVFVAAHTSAGKTVVAEYAFALATKHCTRAVYTAPIKTISNQKYRDFCGKFDVGLLTGDVSLRPEASCLIMTTEILRSMLYRGADIIRDIEWVIFDEVHYVNDAERGVVWEEVIIMLPRHINVVLLSATVPNTIEFADWIGRTKQKKIRVTGTTKRPVPLEHYLFYSGELFKICDNENFIPQGVNSAKDAYKKKNSSTMGSGSLTYSGSSSGFNGARNQSRDYSQKGKQNKHPSPRNVGNLNGASSGNLKSGGQNNSGFRRSDTTSWTQLINKLLKMSLLPVVVFCFSKNRCDKSADAMMGTDLTSSREKSEIRVFCDKAFSRLKGSDRTLPQILRVQSLLNRGIGVHHAGLLPIVKEVVEMLFCRGVIKVLFSTETFAMGVNAPARTVVFDTLRKFDGREFRQILPGEYTQMAGRAGRRGLDKIGTVIVMCRDEIPEESAIKNVMVGRATRLESQFRLTYIMILHLLRVEELKVEDMLKRSFAEFHTQKKLPEKEHQLMLKLAQRKEPIPCIQGEPAIEEYFNMFADAEKYLDQITKVMLQSHVVQQFLTAGRVVVVKSIEGQDHLLGVVVKTPSPSNKQYIVLVLKPNSPPMTQTSSAGGGDEHDKGATKFDKGFFIAPKSKRASDDEYCSAVTTRKGTGVIKIKLPYYGVAAGVNYEVKGVETNELRCICNCKIKVDQVRLLEDVSNAAYSKTVQQLLDLRSDGNKYPPALDPINDLKLKDMQLVDVYNNWNRLLQNMAENKCHGCVMLDKHMELAKEIRKYNAEVDSLRFQMSDEALQQMPDFQGRIDVLQKLGCIDNDLVVQIKGRVACEMNSGEELICTECLFENQLDDLEPEEAVALMSAFVFQQKNTSEPSLTPKLAHAKERLYKTAIMLGQIQAGFKLQIDPQEYAAENLKFGLVEVVYEWAKGTPFADICELTDVPEGLIVRTIVRLDETCREFRNAASIMGNSALYKKMEAASNAIKRDIVFAASLYITGV